MEAIDTFDVEQLSVEIHYDETPMDFEDEFDNDEDSTVIICVWGDRSTISNHNPFATPEEAFQFAKDNNMEVFDLWKYEHGQVAYRAGLTGNSPFSCQFTVYSWQLTVKIMREPRRYVTKYKSIR